jgi:hypothetical protein
VLWVLEMLVRALALGPETRLGVLGVGEGAESA